jgi:NAD-dependent SIR2 family protein deacetylase
MNQLWNKILYALHIKKKPVPYEHPSIDDLVNRNEQIRSMYTQGEKDRVECPNCHDIVKAEDLVQCAKCKREGCKSCYTYDPQQHGYFCDNCW